jgi:hypothetical protein
MTILVLTLVMLSAHVEDIDDFSNGHAREKFDMHHLPSHHHIFIWYEYSKFFLFFS